MSNRARKQPAHVWVVEVYRNRAALWIPAGLFRKRDAARRGLSLTKRAFVDVKQRLRKYVREENP